MRIQQVIESLKQAAPMNVVWGPSCSAVEFLSDWNWALICLADLMRRGHVARVFVPKLEQKLLWALAADRQAPPTYRNPLPELSVGKVPAIYEVGEMEGPEAVEVIRRNASSGPWILLGFEGSDSLPEPLRETGFEHGLYWPGYKAPRHPLPAGANFVAGFDADSFLAYLTAGFAEFPPPSVAGEPVSNRNPAETLYAWRVRFEKTRQTVRDSSPKRLSELIKQVVVARGEEYDRLIAHLWSEFDVYMRFKEEFDSSAAGIWRRLADRRSPHEAKALLHRLRQWQGDFFEVRPDAEQRAFIIAGVNGQLARFHTGAEADALFDEGDRAMEAAKKPLSQQTLVYHASHADLLAKWAIQETGGGSAEIFGRARSMFRKLIEAHGQRTSYLYPSYVYALLDRAKVVSPEEAAGLIAESREYAARFLEGGLTDPDRLWTRARAALGEGDTKEAARAFERFLELKPSEANFVFPKWGEGLGKLGKIDEAEEKFAKAESIAPTHDMYANWAAALVRGRRWDDAARRADRAEELQPGSGAYALAQIAAAQGDREGVRRWLGRSAEYGMIPSLVEALRDPAMAGFRDEVREVF